MTELILLERDGVAVVIDARGTALPRVLHWGAALGPLNKGELRSLATALDRQTPPATLDAPWQLTMMPVESDGWSGRPGIQLRVDGRLHHPRWSAPRIDPEPYAVTYTVRDADTGIHLHQRVEVAPGGLLLVDASLQHTGDRGADAVEVEWLEPTMPVPTTVSHLTTFDGRWTREKRPVTTLFPAGASARQSRRGRPGHDAATMSLASEGEPHWQQGRVWASHLAWPGDSTYRTDRITDSTTLLGGGELFRPGELVLAGGDHYRAPRVLFAHSDEGLDGIAAQVHTWLRSRPQHPRSDRPFTLNTWEAVYFDQEPERLLSLADRAAEVGVERFVLDDGWFRGRRDDTTSLGDWFVDTAVWPLGLAPLADRVHDLGMQFGLWFEPEMISLDSELARAHPEWLLHDPQHLDHDPALSWRTQYVLDLAAPEAYAHIRDRISALVAELDIDYIKWDHNRDLVNSEHDGIPGTHAQTAAVLRLIGELKERHPALEIESCSSGGARTDLGILQVTDRVWASDSNDPVERQDIQRWTGLLLPPELVGAHVGPTASHSSGRVTDLSYRMATSLLGCAGLEWDILTCDPQETNAIARFSALYRELRPVVHTGRVVHPTLRDPAWRVTGHISMDASEAVVIVATVASLEDARAERLRVPGLDPQRRYRLRVRDEIGEAKLGWIVPPWVTQGAEVSGAALGRVGIQLPTLWPCQALGLHLVASD